MSNHNTEPHHEISQRADELHDGSPAHVHQVAEHHGHQGHIAAHEHTRQTQEHSEGAHEHGHTATVGHGISSFGHNDIAKLAYELWEARGRPEGSAERDWFRAAEELRARAHTTGHH